MIWYECFLIVAGISLDIFAVMEVQGSMLASVKKKALIIACAITCGIQLLFFFGGYVLCYLLAVKDVIADAEKYGETIAALIFLCLGVRLIVKAIKREFVNESRRDGMKVKDYARIVVATSLYTLVAGCACGFVGASVIYLVIFILICSILVVVGGVYMGFHFGFENKTIAYVAGAVLLWITGAEIILHRVAGLI